VIVVPGPLAEPAARLLAALAARGWADTAGVRPGPDTLVLADGPDESAIATALSRLAERPWRVLVLSRLGAHPDAHAPSLRRLWAIEESARAQSEAPVLTLRLAPLVGPEAPLWRWLRSRPVLPRGGRALLTPVAEADVIATLERALSGQVPWAGWYELAGRETRSLAEWRDLAVATPGPTEGGRCEPALEEVLEQRLPESEPWATDFALDPTPSEAWCGAGAR
jgi:uncharacterized protein YbjT (DUF2867 family)